MYTSLFRRSFSGSAHAPAALAPRPTPLHQIDGTCSSSSSSRRHSGAVVGGSSSSVISSSGMAGGSQGHHRWGSRGVRSREGRGMRLPRRSRGGGCSSSICSSRSSNVGTIIVSSNIGCCSTGSCRRLRRITCDGFNHISHLFQ